MCLNVLTSSTKCSTMEHPILFEQLRQRREVLGVTQVKLSELSGIALRTINLIESGSHNPSVETIMKLAAVLGMELKLDIKQVN